MKHSPQRKRQPSPGAVSALTLTPRQLQILRLIQRYRASNGCSPTMQELAEQLNVNKVTVFEHVDTLVKKGLLHRVPNKARSLTLDPMYELPESQKEDHCGFNDRPGRFPLLGRIVAGSPLETFPTAETLELDTLFESRRETFALRVHGDSMIDEQIRDGDIVLVEKTDTARNGQIVVALLEDGQTTLKTFYKKGGKYHLQPANPHYDPIIVDQLTIQGVVIGVLRKYQ